MTTYFERLGVGPDATSAQIAEAYRARARTLHPDTQPHVTPAQRERMTQAMAEVNEAWNVLKDDGRRAAYVASMNRDVPKPGPVVRPPLRDECLMCGSYPAIDLTFRHQRAWVIGATAYASHAVLCRSCGTAMGRSAQNQTMWLGWWGLLSFFR